MTDERITELAAQTNAGLAAGDLLVTVDVSDTSMAATGTDKKIPVSELDLRYDAAGTATTAVATEATARASADSTNAAAITAEASTRATADTTNANAITAEAATARAAESANATAITSEATTRASADTTNANAITAEASTARAAESTNATAITAEASARAAADTAAIATAEAFAVQRANHTGTQAESTVTNLVTDLAAKMLALTRTTVKTANYTAVSGDLVPCDSASGGFTITLPAAAQGAIVAVKHVTQGSTNAITVACAGSDVFNKMAGATTLSLSLLAQGVVLVGAAGIWTIVADDLALAQLDARYLATGSDGTYGASNLVPQITLANGRISAIDTNTLAPARYGGLFSYGHSYTQVDGTSKSGGASGYIARFSNWPHRVAAVMGIGADEVYLYGKSGAAASKPYNGDGATVQGVGEVLNFSHPNHIFAGPGFATQLAASRAWPALYCLNYGYNEWSYDFYASSTAWQHGFRTIISRFQARALYFSDDATIAYTGTWTNDTSRNYVSKRKSKKSTTNGDSFTITLPATLNETTTVAVCLIARPGAHTLVNSSPLTSGQTTLPVTTGTFGQGRDIFPQSGNFVVKIDNEEIQVQGGWGSGIGVWTPVVRGVNGTSAASHLFAADVNRATDTAWVTWSGTAANATGTTYLAGQGAAGDEIQIVKRFAVTSADAGKTIVGTYGVATTHSDDDMCLVDSWWIEDSSPPTVLVLNQPLVNTQVSNLYFAGLNTGMAAVVAEFGSNVSVVDVATYFSDHYSATIQANVTADSTANHASQTVHITPNNAAACEIGRGSLLAVDSGSSREEMLVTAITKTSNTDWNLTVTRNYSGGSDCATASGNLHTNVAHSAGVFVQDQKPWSTDRIHPSDYGAEIYASKVIDALNSQAQTSLKVAGSGGMTARRQPRLPDGGFLYTPGGTRTTVASAVGCNTQNRLCCSRVYVPDLANGIKLSFELTAGTPGSGATGRCVIYTDGVGYPQNLIYDSGTTSITGGAAVYDFSSIWVPLRPGWYWLGYVPQGNATVGTIRATLDAKTSYGAIFPTAQPLGSAFTDVTGVYLDSVSGAAPDPFGTPTGTLQHAPAVTLQIAAPVTS